MKTNSRHLILSMGLEFHSQNLKNQLSHISSRMKNNLSAIREIFFEEDDRMTDSYFDLMALSVLRRKAYLYDFSVEKRYLFVYYYLLLLFILFCLDIKNY